MKTLLLIDSHALIHRFYHALPPLTTPEGDPIQAIYGLSNVLLTIVQEQRPDYIAAALDRPEPTFRKEEFKEYKSNRPPAADALVSQLKRITEVFDAFTISAFSSAGFEADDVIGTLTDHYGSNNDLQIAILSGDLDILQLVDNDRVVVDIIQRGTTHTKRYNAKAVFDRFGLSPTQLPDYKGLVGDSSDNIPGIAGVGAKTATEVLQEFPTLEELFENVALIRMPVSRKLQGQRDAAMFSRELATIRRDVPLEFLPLNNLETHAFSEKTLSQFFDTLGFTSLVRRLAAPTI
jgi:DNA polymerase I